MRFATFLVVTCSLIFTHLPFVWAETHTYLVEWDAPLDVSGHKRADHSIDLNRLRISARAVSGSANSRLTAFVDVMDGINPISVRKLIRRLPDDVTTLRSRRGDEFSVAHFQKLFVVETLQLLDESFIAAQKENNPGR